MKLVCIPAYNEESHIENIVKLAKNYVDSVIVCDDCSTDDTANIAKKAIPLAITKNPAPLSMFYVMICCEIMNWKTNLFPYPFDG